MHFVSHFKEEDTFNVPQHEQLLWINTTDDVFFSILSFTSFSGFRKPLNKGNFSITQEEHFQHQEHFGTLCYGRQYIRYPVLFYEESSGLSPFFTRSNIWVQYTLIISYFIYILIHCLHQLVINVSKVFIT